MTTLTKEQWAEIESRLSFPFGEVNLIADGYRLTLQVQSFAALRQVIVVFVDGIRKHEWYKGEATEAKKFCRESRRWLFGAKDRENAKKKLKQRRLDPYLRKWYKETAESFSTTWMPYWPTPKPLIRHLRKTCTSVELVEKP